MHAGCSSCACVFTRLRATVRTCASLRKSARMCARVYECACLNKTWLHFSGCIFSGRDLSTV